MIPKSAVPEVLWPAIPPAEGALLLAVMHQLEESEWMPVDEVRELQLEALDRLFDHARASVPFYRQRAEYDVLDGREGLGADDWSLLPILTRADVQEAGTALHSENVPSIHHPLTHVVTSGATGRPIRGIGTAVTTLFWRAITLRDQLWHRRDVTARLCAIRDEETPPEGRESAAWGPSTASVYHSGPCGVSSVSHDVAVQAAWLVEQNPEYVLTYPSNLMALVQHLDVTGGRLPRVRQACTYGEALSDDLRPLVRRVLGVDVVDIYSSNELGYIALQCPKSEQYHVQSESAYVEVLDDHGHPCAPGEIGRVVVSALHNYGMPLLRYELGDYAEVGSPCSCGRGLPTLARVMGRQRNMWALPGGRWIWPQFTWNDWGHIGDIRQMQLVQHELDRVEARIVGPRPLTADEQAELAAIMQRRFGYAFQVSFTFLDAIERTSTRKFEDFVSRVAQPGGASQSAERQPASTR
ncbi:MAG: phenylacetate--CoA ligase family protein [Actinomycetota bacterium]|nr:phenylacetate--CoA ligase family protein [Actinomycetota bacterium]